ncbi:MAG: hypothetical protein A2293_09675 [Elusimicrobia bacterium RIFOXYB2_FULL_49_7]|nr:MAG: hypothetical protein A2293_09675 [Elusimicrobia bacterium RIFOXYB2_FULL_49_7]
MNKAEVSDISLVTDFINEANDHLESIETKTMELETDPSNATLLNDIFRPLHTIKGVSGFLGMRHVNQVAHESETLLDLARTGKIFMDREGIDIVFDVIDVIRRLLQLLDQEVKGHAFSDEEYPQVEIFLEQLKALTREKQAAGVEGLSATVQLKSNKKLGELLVEKAVMTQEDLSDALATQADDSEGRKLGQILVEEKKASPRAIAQALRDQRDVTVQTDSGSIKVDTQKLDNLIDVVGELVISQTLLAQNPALTASRDPALSKQVNHLTKIVRDIQYISMALRMLPIKATFQKMSRLVRDLSNKSGKQVELSINGAETELDKNVIEQINDPLVHMVRNAADHGIETPEERAKAGKSAVGRIVLNAYHQGGNIVIEIQDDGKGLNKNKIRKKAVEKGLIPADVQMDEAELFNLIFLPGFSTADKVTDISGRGVGMDVVRKNIEKLGGNVSIGSTEGKGTTFTIRLPLTMAILDGMVIQVGSERFLLPVLSIKESLRPKRNEVSTVQNKGEVVNVRGNLIQLIRLHKLFNLVSTIEKPWEGLVIIVDLNGRHYGILVDGLLGQQQVVIKSLKAEFKQIKGVSGAAILGDGHVGLILDPKGIVEIGNSDENSDKEVA